LTLHQKELVKVWIAAGLWMILIAIESTSYLSSANTGRFLYPLLHFLFGIENSRFLVLHHYLRKIGHFVGYFILSFLLFRAWRITLPRFSGWAMRWATIAFFMSVLVASLDEWHQSYLPSRTGTIQDVILDSIAALTAQIVILLWLQSRREIKPEEASVYAGPRG
jgi:VanZ family protein